METNKVKFTMVTFQCQTHTRGYHVKCHHVTPGKLVTVQKTFMHKRLPGDQLQAASLMMMVTFIRNSFTTGIQEVSFTFGKKQRKWTSFLFQKREEGVEDWFFCTNFAFAMKITIDLFPRHAFGSHRTPKVPRPDPPSSVSGQDLPRDGRQPQRAQEGDKQGARHTQGGLEGDPRFEIALGNFGQCFLETIYISKKLFKLTLSSSSWIHFVRGFELQFGQNCTSLFIKHKLF